MYCVHVVHDTMYTQHCMCVSLCSATFKYPWARGLCYKGGLGKNGLQQLQEVVRYPSEVPNQFCGPTYPSLILPFPRVHLKVGGSSVRPLKMLRVFSVPPDLPLALAFTHSLVSHSLASSGENPSSLATLHSAQALSATLEGLARLLTRLDIPLILKERTLHLFSQVLWTLSAIAPPALTPSALPPDLLQGLRQEVLALYEHEVGRFSKAKNKSSYPPPGSISEGGQGKFSTYLQSLLECLLAAVSYSAKFHSVDSDAASLSSPVSSSSSSLSSSESATSGVVGRRRAGRGLRGRRAPRSGGVTRGDSAEISPKKREEWLGVVTNASALLTSLTSEISSSAVGSLSLPQSNCEAALASSLPVHPCSRLVMITGLPCNLPVDETRERLRRVCRPFGGLHDNHFYLPTREISLESEGTREKEEEDTQTQQTEDASPQSQTTSDPATVSTQESAQELVGHAVLELNCSANNSFVCSSILSLPSLHSVGERDGGLAATAVSETLRTGENEAAETVLEEFLRHSLIRDEEVLVPLARDVLQSIFESGKKETSPEERKSEKQESMALADDLFLFLTGFEGSGREAAEVVWREIQSFVALNVERAKGAQVTVEEFLQWCGGQAVRNPRKVWLGLFACGYDLHFMR